MINKVDLTSIKIGVLRNQVRKISVISITGGFSLYVVLSEVVVFFFFSFLQPEKLTEWPLSNQLKSASRQQSDLVDLVKHLLLGCSKLLLKTKRVLEIAKVVWKILNLHKQRKEL